MAKCWPRLCVDERREELAFFFEWPCVGGGITKGCCELKQSPALEEKLIIGGGRNVLGLPCVDQVVMRYGPYASKTEWSLCREDSGVVGRCKR